MYGQNFDPFNQQQNQQRPIAGTPINNPMDGKKTRGKILRFMFNPEFGEDIRNMRQNHTHFLKLVTNIFLQTGLIDASYQGLRDNSQLGLRSLVETAFKNLQFTKEGLPQVLLFFTFVGSMAVIVMCLLFFMISLGSSPHARMS